MGTRLCSSFSWEHLKTGKGVFVPQVSRPGVLERQPQCEWFQASVVCLQICFDVSTLVNAGFFPLLWAGL